MAALSDLLVKLDMDSARFREELNRAGNELGKFGEQIAKAGELVKHALEFEIIREAATKLFEFVRAGAEAADQLEKMSQRTGIATDELQKLQYAATLADVSHEQLTKGLDKLAKNMAHAASGTGAQAEAFAAMGIKVKDAEGKLRPTSEVIGDIAEKFSHYKDGPEKAALAMELFGKTGAELIPLLNQGKDGLKEMGDEAERFGIILDEKAIKSAAEFEDDVKKLHAASGGLKTLLAAEMAPALDVLAKKMLEGAQKGGQLQSFMEGIAKVAKGVEIAVVGAAGGFQYLGQYIAGTAAIINAALHGDFAAASRINDENARDLANTYRSTLKTVKEIWESDGKNAAESAKKVKQDINAPLVGKLQKDAKDTLAIIDAQTKAALALQKEAERERTAVLDDSYKTGATTLKDYYKQRIAIQNESYDNEIGLLRKKIAQAEELEKSGDPKDKQKYQVKLIELNGQLQLAEAKRLNSTLDLQLQETDALKSQAKAMRDLAIISGEKIDQASIVAQTDELQQQRALMQTSNTAYFEKLKQLEVQSLNDARRVEQEKFANFQGTDEAKKLAMQASHDRIEELERNHAEKIKQIDRQMELDRVKFSIEAENSIKSNLESGIAAFLDGTKTLKQAFKDLATSILADISRMLAKQWVEQLVGAGTGGGDLLNKLFGIAGSFGGGGSGGAAAAAPALPNGLNSTSAFSGLFAAGAAADGGPLGYGSSYLVGEHGPEMFTPNVSGNITPNSAMGGSITNNFMISAPNGQVSRESQMQIAAAAARGLASANKRNN